MVHARPTGHLRVHDASPRRHPLQAARADHTAVSGVILVLESALQHVGDRLEPPVRVGRETGRGLYEELIEQQERVNVHQLVRSYRPFHSRAVALGHLHGRNDAGDTTRCHACALHLHA